MIEMLEGGQRAAEQLQQLQAKEFGGTEKPQGGVAVTILKILTIIAGVFFALLSAMSLPPDMAFISITFITITVAALVTGAEKIVAIFPRRIWIWRSDPHPPVYYPPPRPHHPAPPPKSKWAWYFPWTWGSGGHSVYSGRGAPSSGGHPTSSHAGGSSHGGGSGSSSSSWSSSGTSGAPSSHTGVGGGHAASSRGGHHTTGGYSAVGGGHDSSSIAGGTGNVAVGSGRHDRRNTTPGGNVIPGSRRR